MNEQTQEQEFINRWNDVFNVSPVDYITKSARMNFDIDNIMRKAEQRISYSAKKAIEMYYEVWLEKPAYGLFLKCAEHYGLDEHKIEACRLLMKRFGMVEIGS